MYQKRRNETKQTNDRKILENLYQKEFSGKIENLALAPGRDSERIEKFFKKEERINDDLSMKIRGIAEERNVETL